MASKPTAAEELALIDEAYEEQKRKMEILASRSPQVSITLGVKIKLNGIEVDKITMRRPTANDFADAQDCVFKDTDGARLDEDGQNAQRERFLIGRLAGAPPEEVGQCEMADWGMCQAALQGFLRGRVSKRG